MKQRMLAVHWKSRCMRTQRMKKTTATTYIFNPLRMRKIQCIWTCILPDKTSSAGEPTVVTSYSAWSTLSWNKELLTIDSCHTTGKKRPEDDGESFKPDPTHLSSLEVVDAQVYAPYQTKTKDNDQKFCGEVGCKWLPFNFSSHDWEKSECFHHFVNYNIFSVNLPMSGSGNLRYNLMMSAGYSRKIFWLYYWAL